VKHSTLVWAAEFSQTVISRGNGCEKGWGEFLEKHRLEQTFGIFTGDISEAF